MGTKRFGVEWLALYRTVQSTPPLSKITNRRNKAGVRPLTDNPKVARH
jgi:hypothetical protein